MKIYGHEVDLTEVDHHEVITDVMIIARSVSYTPDGRGQDAVLISTTHQTPGMVQLGMLHFALDTMREDDE